jgi:hypothetical protein
MDLHGRASTELSHLQSKQATRRLDYVDIYGSRAKKESARPLQNCLRDRHFLEPKPDARNSGTFHEPLNYYVHLEEYRRSIILT